MQEIQTACATLARHQDSSVSHLALRIAEFDLIRDLNHDNRCVEMDALISTRSAEIKVLKADNRLLRAQVNKLADMKFGPSSEKTDSQSKNDKPAPEGPQCSAASSAPKNPDDTKKQETKPRGMLGRQAVKIPDNLPRDRRVIEPENGSICACGCGMRLMGEQVIERLSYKPAEVRVIEEHYPKYVCRTCERFVQAPVPKRAFDYTRYDDSLIAGLAVSKFADFLPNYRQEQIFKRSGIRLHRSSMSRMMDEAVNALLPLHAALEVDLKTSSKLFMDETVLAQLQPGSGRTKTCYIWALCRDDRRWKGNAPPAVVFHFKQSRKGAHALEILNGFHGILQVDGYAGYNGLTRAYREGGALNLAYCWAHVRRKFPDVHKATKSEKANEVFELINRLYDIERDLKGQPAGVRLATRQAGSAPLVAKIFARIREISTQIAMKSSLGQAITYTMKLAEGLKIFLTDGRVEIDSNPVENTIRPIALLRKNALFAGSEVGGRNWAVMASIIGTCRLNGVEPYAYLTWVFEQMAKGYPRSQYDKLLPWHCPNGRFGIE